MVLDICAEGHTPVGVTDGFRRCVQTVALLGEVLYSKILEYEFKELELKDLKLIILL